MRYYAYEMVYPTECLPELRRICEGADHTGRVPLSMLPALERGVIVDQAKRDGKTLPIAYPVIVGYYSRKPGQWTFSCWTEVEDDAFIAETAE